MVSDVLLSAYHSIPTVSAHTSRSLSHPSRASELPVDRSYLFTEEECREMEETAPSREEEDGSLMDFISQTRTIVQNSSHNLLSSLSSALPLSDAFGCERSQYTLASKLKAGVGAPTSNKFGDDRSRLSLKYESPFKLSAGRGCSTGYPHLDTGLKGNSFRGSATLNPRRPLMSKFEPSGSGVNPSCIGIPNTYSYPPMAPGFNRRGGKRPVRTTKYDSAYKQMTKLGCFSSESEKVDINSLCPSSVAYEILSTPEKYAYDMYHEGFTIRLGADGRRLLLRKLRNIYNQEPDHWEHEFLRNGLEHKNVFTLATVTQLFKIAHLMGSDAWDFALKCACFTSKCNALLKKDNGYDSAASSEASSGKSGQNGSFGCRSPANPESVFWRPISDKCLNSMNINNSMHPNIPKGNPEHRSLTSDSVISRSPPSPKQIAPPLSFDKALCKLGDSGRKYRNADVAFHDVLETPLNSSRPYPSPISFSPRASGYPYNPQGFVPKRRCKLATPPECGAPPSFPGEALSENGIEKSEGRYVALSRSDPEKSGRPSGWPLNWAGYGHCFTDDGDSSGCNIEGHAQNPSPHMVGSDRVHKELQEHQGSPLGYTLSLPRSAPSEDAGACPYRKTAASKRVPGLLYQIPHLATNSESSTVSSQTDTQRETIVELSDCADVREEPPPEGLFAAFKNHLHEASVRYVRETRMPCNEFEEEEACGSEVKTTPSGTIVSTRGTQTSLNCQSENDCLVLMDTCLLEWLTHKNKR